MTYVVKHSGAPRQIAAEFRCPIHGVFTALADSGTDTVTCPRVMVRPLPYVADPEGYIRDLPVRCNEPSPWSPSVIPMRMRRVEAVRGKNDTPGHRDWDFTANLEEGQDPDEWQADRDAAAERRREQFVYDAVRED